MKGLPITSIITLDGTRKGYENNLPYMASQAFQGGKMKAGSRPANTVGGKYTGKKSSCHNVGLWARPAAYWENGKLAFGVYLPICSECHSICNAYDINPRPVYVKQSGSSMFNKLLAALKKLFRKVKK